MPRDNSETPQTRESYSRIRIGLATAKCLSGPWETLEKPLLEPRPGKWDSQIVTNPAPCILPDGRVLLYYRSNTPDGLRIGVAGADSFGGPYRRLNDDPVIRLVSGDHMEDPFVWWSGKRYEMLAKDMLGGITGEVHAGAHFFSEDGLRWLPTQSPKAYSRRVRFDDATVVTLGCLERPQLLFDETGHPSCLFAAADGPGGFLNASTTWNIAIPLARRDSRKAFPEACREPRIGPQPWPR